MELVRQDIEMGSEVDSDEEFDHIFEEPDDFDFLPATRSAGC